LESVSTFGSRPRPAANKGSVNKFNFFRLGEERQIVTLAEAIPHLVWTASADGSADYFNQRWYEFTGLNWAQSRGHNWHYAVHPEDRKIHSEQWANAVKLGTGYETELRMKSHTASGHRWMLLRSTPLRNQSGDVFKWVGTFTDYQSERESLKTKVEQAEAALNKRAQFIANISHEIRTPLSGVLGMAELLADGQLNAADKDLANQIHDSALSLLHIVNELLDFSKLEAGKVHIDRLRFSTPSVVRNVTGSIAPIAGKKGIAVRMDCDPAIPDELIGDRMRVQQVLLNLANNALKFTPRGSITIKAELLEDTAEDVEVLFSVTDTGIGIAECAQASLFEPFSQVDSMAQRYGGTGLGLSICKRLVQLMSGEIGLDSKKDVGSTFWFKLRFNK
jgi:PAS domain S-box-containing protein